MDEACEVTGLRRTKLYELIGAGRIVTTTIGRRRPGVVQSLLALLDTNMSN
ncbi:excisionase [Bradyrhizobium frederickii]|uniref:Excisionase n=1 Tax=Bradyrhizobium frederickii TaxID=2560054 RepID=A0A4Y9PQK0_9BRAD|nr:excisionase [Bradyrhizobium frederickii]